MFLIFILGGNSTKFYTHLLSKSEYLRCILKLTDELLETRISEKDISGISFMVMFIIQKITYRDLMLVARPIRFILRRRGAVVC